jgi:hypothetical protein
MKPGYITITRRESNNQCLTPPKKNPSAKIFWKVSHLKIFGIKIIFRRAETIYAEYYSSLPMQLKDILKEKRRGKFNKCPVLAR